MAAGHLLSRGCIPTLLPDPGSVPPTPFLLQIMGCASTQFPMQYMAIPQPGVASPAPAPPAKRKHAKKKRVDAPPPAHATHYVAASGEHANSSEAWLSIPDECNPSTEGPDIHYADDSLGGDWEERTRQ
eukprot:3294765-Rhodomonas_salina.1